MKSRKVAIITGADSGIGTWLAKHLHNQNYRVAICGHGKEEQYDDKDVRPKNGKSLGARLADSLDGSGGTAMSLQCEVDSFESQKKIFEQVWYRWNRIDIIIAHSSFVDRRSVYSFGRRDVSVENPPSEPDMSRTDTDFKGVIYTTTLATHFMRQNPHRKGGKIIVTGSMIGTHPSPTFPEYCAAKAAVHQWVRAMGPVLKLNENITMNCVMPRAIEAGALQDFSKVVQPEQRILMSNIMNGYDRFLNDHSVTGQVIEAANGHLIDEHLPHYESEHFAGLSEKIESLLKRRFKVANRDQSGLPSDLQISSNSSKASITDVYPAAKDAGFPNFKTFLNAYGLEISYDDDVIEGQKILGDLGYGVCPRR
ncbi:hypothetical protein DPSP01_014685 [Paraphaeosphaeria sporulosa]